MRETFGVLIGSYHARAARDPEIAALMREIAADETRHAALAQATGAWVSPQLTEGARDRIARARARAVRELAAELRCEPSGAVRDVAGFPDAAAALAMHSAMRAELWS